MVVARIADSGAVQRWRCWRRVHLWRDHAPSSLCAAGWFGGEVALGSVRLHSAGSHDALVACFTAAGVPAWARRAGGAAADQAAAIVADGERVIAAGAAQAGRLRAQAGGGRGRPTVVAAWRLADGAPLWRQRFGGPIATPRAALTADGTVWAAGSFLQAAPSVRTCSEPGRKRRSSPTSTATAGSSAPAGCSPAPAMPTALAVDGAGPSSPASSPDRQRRRDPAERARRRNVYLVAFDRDLDIRWARRLGGLRPGWRRRPGRGGDRLALARTFVDGSRPAGARCAAARPAAGWLRSVVEGVPVGRRATLGATVMRHCLPRTRRGSRPR
jgi:hypothetical protein